MLTALGSVQLHHMLLMLQDAPDPRQIQHMMMVMGPVIFVSSLVGLALIIVPFWVIFKKAGLGGPLSLLMLIPFVGIIMLYVLAFSRWKVVPAPEYAVGYPPAYPPGYVPPAAAAYPPVTSAPPSYVAPRDDSSRF